MAMEPVGGGDAADHPYRLVGFSRTQRPKSDGTFQSVVNITLGSTLYDVEFTFTLLAETFDNGGAPPLEAERTNWVDEICGYRHVQDFWSEQDQGPGQVLYNYGVITVGTDDGSITDQLRVRMDRLNLPGTFAAIDAVWSRLVAAGAQ